MVKNLPANAGDLGEGSSIPGLGRLGRRLFPGMRRNQNQKIYYQCDLGQVT